MKTLYLHYLGGMGNQLFTYAFGISLARKYNRKLILDTEDFYNGYTDPSYLSRLALGNYVELRKLYPHCIIKYVLRIIRRFGLFQEKKEFCFQEIKNVELKNNTYLEGYWQSDRYFSSDADYIRSIFRLKSKSDNEKLNLFVSKYDITNYTSVHIRRGDYVGGGRLVEDSYYDKALTVLEDKAGEQKYAVFSDDIEYAKNMSCFKSRNCLFVERKMFEDDLISLFVMSNCKNNIIVNSSYSWWAAWLNPNKEKIVIAPEVSYLENTDFYPADWLKVATRCN